MVLPSFTYLYPQVPGATPGTARGTHALPEAAPVASIPGGL
ncbi:MAG: hypothetical protein ABSE16_09115 [Verrucomicrobiota bacterium]